MKPLNGFLYKVDGKWFVVHLQATLNGPLIQLLPLLDNGYVNGLGLYDSNDGLEVEFEIVEGNKARLL